MLSWWRSRAPSASCAESSASSSSAFEQLTSTGNTTVDYHNTQLLSNQDLSVLLEMATPTLQAGFNLEINTYSSLFELSASRSWVTVSRHESSTCSICFWSTPSFATSSGLCFS